jgi:hypothetical protein
MKEIIRFLKNSNRWLHLICGALAALAVAFISLIILVTFGATIAIPLIAILAVSLIAVAHEIKDVQGGGKFDWTDLAVTIIGAILILIPICFFCHFKFRYGSF